MYDLLLFDMRMPGMNGFELFQRIKDKEHEYGENSMKMLSKAIEEPTLKASLFLSDCNFL